MGRRYRSCESMIIAKGMMLSVPVLVVLSILLVWFYHEPHEGVAGAGSEHEDHHHHHHDHPPLDSVETEDRLREMEKILKELAARDREKHPPSQIPQEETESLK